VDANVLLDFSSLSATFYGCGSPILSRRVSCISSGRSTAHSGRKDALPEPIDAAFKDVLSAGARLVRLRGFGVAMEIPRAMAYPESLRQARRRTLKAFLERDAPCSPPDIEELWPLIRDAIRPTRDAAVITCAALPPSHNPVRELRPVYLQSAVTAKFRCGRSSLIRASIAQINLIEKRKRIRRCYQ
jgi:hypothetical protein